MSQAKNSPTTDATTRALLALLGDKTIAYRRVFARIGGGVTAGLLLSQSWYWSQRTNNPDGSFYKTQQDFEAETGLTRKELETARKKLKQSGLLTWKLQGVPPVTHYKVNIATLIKALSELDNQAKKPAISNLPVSDKLNRPKGTNQFARFGQIINTESTTEITTDTHTDGDAPSALERADGAHVSVRLSFADCLAWSLYRYESDIHDFFSEARRILSEAAFEKMALSARHVAMYAAAIHQRTELHLDLQEKILTSSELGDDDENRHLYTVRGASASGKVKSEYDVDTHLRYALQRMNQRGKEPINDPYDYALMNYRTARRDVIIRTWLKAEEKAKRTKQTRKSQLVIKSKHRFEACKSYAGAQTEKRGKQSIEDYAAMIQASGKEDAAIDRWLQEAKITGAAKSRFTLEECKQYANHLHLTGQGIKQPAAYAKTIFRSGEDDAEIERLLSRDTAVKIATDFNACPDCKGKGVYYPNGFAQGVKKCKHPNLRLPNIENNQRAIVKG